MHVNGKTIDEHTRCIHYHSGKDIIAIKFKCCNEYYACMFCHEETAGHPHEVWPAAAFNTMAVICGICHTEMSIEDYKCCGYECPACHAAFNPACSKHDHYYFESSPGSIG